MPIDFRDETQTKQFKETMLSKGYDEARINNFIASKSPIEKVIQPGETLSGIAQEAGTSVEELARKNLIQNPDLIRAGETLTINKPEVINQPTPAGKINTGLSQKGAITQRFGVRNPIYPSGVHTGTDIGVPTGTGVAVPDGRWKVIESFGGATVQGPNNVQKRINRWYGNSILVQNMKTGEKLRFSHLKPGGVFVRPGQEVEGGTVVGQTGATGNVVGETGEHLDLEYYTPAGSLRDVLNSPYGQFYL